MNDAFRRWFGKSVLVDKAGKPLVLYHGTTKTFDRFKISDGNFGQGIYLAPEGLANTYARGEGGRMIPVFARVEHPLWVDWHGNEGQRKLSDISFDPERKAAKKTIGQWLQHKGYDGVIVTVKGEIHMVNVLSPKQVKSIHNKGTWSRATSVLTNPSLGRPNPSLGNSGWEFKQRAYLELLAQAIELEGLNPATAEEMAEKAFRLQKRAWQEMNNRILPVKDYPVLRAQATLSLARFVSEGGLRPPGPRLRRNPTTSVVGRSTDAEVMFQGEPEEDWHWIEETVPLSRLRQFRESSEGLNDPEDDVERWAAVAKWVDDMHGGDFLQATKESPLLVKKTPHGSYLVDGWHRLHVARKRRAKRVVVVTVIDPQLNNSTRANQPPPRRRSRK